VEGLQVRGAGGPDHVLQQQGEGDAAGSRVAVEWQHAGQATCCSMHRTLRLAQIPHAAMLDCKSTHQLGRTSKRRPALAQVGQRGLKPTTAPPRPAGGVLSAVSKVQTRYNMTQTTATSCFWCRPDSRIPAMPLYGPRTRAWIPYLMCSFCDTSHQSGWRV
jgi:hypothetical protein